MDTIVHRLAAVMFADVVGYSALAARDENAAVRLVGIFHETARREIERGGGHLVQFIGDAAFADFPSTDLAVRTAIALQAAFPARAEDAGLTGQLRIGVHVGDVVSGENGDLFGDGVNVASRLHREAAPGQVFVSQDVWRQIRQRPGFRCQSVGERRLKGIPGSIWVFAVEAASEYDESLSDFTAPARAPARIPRLLSTALMYISASAVILLATSVITAGLELPSWVIPGAIVLLVIGLLVVLPTSWAQSRPGWERQVGQPSAWQLNWSGLVEAIGHRRIPALTWARAILGGVVAFAVLFGLAAIYVQAGGRLPFPRPAVAYAEPEPAVAILPFVAQGVDPELWGEGIVDLLSVALDEVAGVRVIDPRAVLSRSAGERTHDAAAAIRVGAALSARYAATGSVVASPGEIRFTAEVYDVRSRELVGSAQADGAPDSLPAIVESLARQIADETEIGTRASAALNFRRITTGSVAALKYYLRGERHLRRSEWNRAMMEYERALEADSAFALAFYRLALAHDWNSARHVPRQSQYIERATRYAGNLPRRGRLLIEGYAQLALGSQAAINTLEEMVALYPDDVDGWFLLGDAYYHLPSGTRPERDEFRDAMVRAIQLDSTFAPAYVHLMEDAYERRDTASLARWIAGLRAAEPGSPLLSGYDWAAALRPESAVAHAGEDSATDETVVERTPRTQSTQPRTTPDRPAEREATPGPSQPLGRDTATPQTPVVDRPPVTMPPPAPPVARTEPEEVQPAGPPPTAIAEAVLARLKVAIEQEDLRAVRSVWTTLTSQESQSFRLLFDAVRDLSVSYVIQGVDRTNGRIQVRVQTTYTFYNEREQQRSRSITNQVFDLTQQGGGWVIGQ
jgi:class 3 adenylate cyclase/TolB-like protein